MDFLTLIKAAAALLVGAAAGYFLRQFIALKRNDSLELKAKQILLDAKESARKFLDDAKSRAEKVLEGAKDEQKERERDLRRLEERITHKDETLEKRSQELDKETNAIKEKVEKLRAMKENFEKIDAEKRLELEKVAKLSTEEAKEKLITEVEKKYESDILARIQKMERFGLEELERKARNILASTIQRIASSTASEVTVTSVTIPSDDLKGKIIGKRSEERRVGKECRSRWSPYH